LAASLDFLEGVQLGPGNCVSLSRSTAGTCVIGNACEGVDTSRYEYAFNCWNSPQNLVRHSFGVGGFDADEEFDTGVPCRRCEPPSKLAAQKAEPQVPAKSRSLLAAKTTVQVAKAKFGPGQCVSTWKDNRTGHCMMETNCTNESMENYVYGLLCTDKDNEPVKHLFGKNSFDPEETFDTLLICAECAGVEDEAFKVNATVVAELESDVKELGKMLKEASKAVIELNAKVFKPELKLDVKPKSLLLHREGQLRQGSVPAAVPVADADDEAEEEQSSDDTVSEEAQAGSDAGKASVQAGSDEKQDSGDAGSEKASDNAGSEEPVAGEDQ